MLNYYFFFVGGGYNFSYILGNTLYIIVRVGFFFGGGGGGGYRGWDNIWQNFRETPPHTQNSPTVQCHQAGGFPS